MTLQVYHERTSEKHIGSENCLKVSQNCLDTNYDWDYSTEESNCVFDDSNESSVLNQSSEQTPVGHIDRNTDVYKEFQRMSLSFGF